MIRLTDRQQAVVDSRGGVLLVAAAAGAGKTKVLVERLLERICDENDPKNIDEFLIITYTKAAAAELRGRIIEQLGQKLAKQPGYRHLQKQMTLIYLANITTIHAYCARLIRENAHLTGLTPDFRVADEVEASALKDRVLESVVEARYTDMDDGFAALVDNLSAGRDDKKLMGIVLDSYEKLQSHPFPEAWVEGQLRNFDDLPDDMARTVWGAYILQSLKKTAGYWVRTLKSAVGIIGNDEALSKAYGPCFFSELEAFQRLEGSLDGTWAQAAAASRIDFGRLGGLRNYEDKRLQEYLKNVRTRCKKAAEEIAKLFCCDETDLKADMEYVAPVIGQLFALVTDFSRAYMEEKRRRKIADFSDLEHMAVTLLYDPETRSPTELARELSERFCEIMVDEYQDTNAVSDLLVKCLSKKETNRFMVGDVKQSIYRFRLADPTIFLEKYESYSDYQDARQDRPRKILLSDNFRSRPEVIEAVNDVFSSVMSPELGEIEYGESERLIAGNTDYADRKDCRAELNLIDTSGSGTDPDEMRPVKAELEAAFTARRIKRLLDEGFLVEDMKSKAGRTVRPGDIVILLRSVANKGAIYKKELEKLGIACSTDKSDDFFGTVEISVLISLLRVIDNPMQDISLISVLRSPVFGFDAQRLARIRLSDQLTDYYSAMKASEDKDCEEFIAVLDGLRQDAAQLPVDRLIWRILTKTNMLAVFGAMKNGGVRTRNLFLMYEYAGQFESMGYKGVFSFLRYLDSLREKGAIKGASQSSHSADAVTVMSIHKSKGLEYPVVILADLAKRFNREDMRKPLLIHPKLGAGPKRLDLDRMAEYPTIARQAVELQLTREALSEELRVLYVAMTRAREKLIMTCSFQNLESRLQKLSLESRRPMDPQMLLGASSMADWILYAALGRPEGAAVIQNGAAEPGGVSQWEINLIKSDSIGSAKAAPAGDEQKQIMPDQKMVSEIAARLEYVYPYAASAALPSKLTATQIKGRYLDQEAEEYGGEMISRRAPVIVRPRFITEQEGLTSAEKGTALHIVMQHIDFNQCAVKDGISGELRRLENARLITSQQAQSVDAGRLLSFFTSETGQRVLAAENVVREFKFSILIPAKQLTGEGGDDQILLQGVVDCCISDEERLTLIDYKTDQVDEDSAAQRAESYRTQLDTYAMAMEKIFKKPVTGRILYFFSIGKAVALE